MAPPEKSHLHSWWSPVKAACQSTLTNTACLLHVPCLCAAMRNTLRHMTMARYGAGDCSARRQRLCPSLPLKKA